MKYVISGLIYFVILSVIQGVFSALIGHGFIDGFNPLEIDIWRLLIRVVISAYLAHKYPISLK